MKAVKNIFQKGALVYVLVCILQALFLPPAWAGNIDNYFFAFGLINLWFVFANNKYGRKVIIAFGVFFAWSVFAEFISNGFGNVENLPYLLYFLKWPVIIFTLVDEFSRESRKINYHKVLDGSFLVLVGLNLVMLTNFMGIGETIQNLYSPKLYTNFVYFNEPGVYRLAGTQMNSNDNAIIFCAFLIYYICKRPKAWYFIILSLGLLILTQSRTIFMISILIVLIEAILKLRESRNKKILVVVGILAISFLTLIIGLSRNLRSIFNGDAFISNSLFRRFQNLELATESGTNSTLFGNGVIENPIAQLGAHIDSEYIALILQYGLVGLILWGLIVLSTLSLFNVVGTKRVGYYIVLLILGASLTNFTLLHGTIGVIICTFIAVYASKSSKNESEIPKTIPA